MSAFLDVLHARRSTSGPRIRHELGLFQPGGAAEGTFSDDESAWSSVAQLARTQIRLSCYVSDAQPSRSGTMRRGVSRRSPCSLDRGSRCIPGGIKSACGFDAPDRRDRCVVDREKTSPLRQRACTRAIHLRQNRIPPPAWTRSDHVGRIAVEPVEMIRHSI